MSAIGILRSFAEARCADHEPIPARLTYGTIREALRIIEEWERSARKPTNETTPDAVAMLQWMHACVVHSENHGDVPRIGSDEVLAVLRATQDERARHAEEVARLEAEAEELREEVEDWEAAAQELSNQLVTRTKERDSLRDRSPAFAFARIAELESQLTARRAHDAGVRALAQWATETEHMSDHVNTDQIGDVGRRILAALDSQGGEGE